ncbi:aspartic proteinase CDR1-like [Salvia divinorum]|uniref:Aspartic proteinase CDR1-like n=1 Tax=Salvia divinorum TaxID=28513 RepID=A0ABD1I1W2_SALDI
MAKTLISIFFISCITLVSIFSCCKCDQFASAGIDGFTTDPIHRDSPHSPLYNPSLTQKQIMDNALQRSYARSKWFSYILLHGWNATAQSTLIQSDGARWNRRETSSIGLRDSSPYVWKRSPILVCGGRSCHSL